MDEDREMDEGVGESDDSTLVFEEVEKSKGFTMTPNVVLLTPTLSRDAKTLYSILISFARQKEQCFPGYGRLTYHLGCARSQASNYMRELKTAGLIRVERRAMGQTNRYTLLRLPDALLLETFPAVLPSAPPLSRFDDNSGIAGETTVGAPAGQQSSRRQGTKNTQSKKTEFKKTGDTPLPPFAKGDARAQADAKTVVGNPAIQAFIDTLRAAGVEYAVGADRELRAALKGAGAVVAVQAATAYAAALTGEWEWPLPHGLTPLNALTVGLPHWRRRGEGHATGHAGTAGPRADRRLGGDARVNGFTGRSDGPNLATPANPKWNWEPAPWEPAPGDLPDTG